MLLIDVPSWLVIATCVALGLSFGSFLNVVVYRLPRGQSLSHPPSTCPACGTLIRPADNLPLVGWLLLRGRARCCGARISPRYPLVEAVGGLLAYAVLELRILSDPMLGVGEAALTFALYLALGLALVAAALIDLEYMILPDSLTLGGVVVGLASAPFRSDVELVEAAVAAAGGFVVVWLPFIWLYEKVRGMPGMGLGDAKLLALSGAWFGVFGVLFTLFVGAVQGTLVAIGVALAGGKIEEPEAVKREREELLAAIEAAEGEERRELEAIRDADPVATEPEDGLLKARMPFGPFLVLSLLELTLFHEPLRQLILTWLLYG